MKVAIDAAVRKTGATYVPGSVDAITACPGTTTKCLVIQSEVDGVSAAYFRGQIGNSSAAAACFIYVIHDSAGWHFLDMGCAGPESGVSWPDVGSIDYVFNAGTSCANVRTIPGLSGKVVGCLKDGTTVNVDAGPDYIIEPAPRVSHMWWHLQGEGWMAHDYLIVPL